MSLLKKKPSPKAAILLVPVLCALFVFPLVVRAQNITGSLYGMILDQSGYAVPNAKVTAELTARGLIRTATSNRQGEYLFSELPVGSYRITVLAKTFEKTVAIDIPVDAGQSSHRDITVQLGSVDTTVVVASESVGVDTRSATMGTLIDNISLQELPIDGDNVINLTALLPGVTSVTAPASFTGDHSGPTFSASGARVNQNLFLFDGVLYNNLYRNTGLNYPPRDALQEVQALTNNYNAEYGRNAGSIFQVVTKSGTNKFHGSLWETAKNTAFNAANYERHMVLPLIQNQFGFTFGGPILKNKLFFMTSYQGFRLANTTYTGSPAFTTGTSLASGRPIQYIDANTDANVYTSIYDPKSGQYAKTIPHAEFDPVAVSIINAFSLSTPNGDIQTTLKVPQNDDRGLIRADFSSGRHTVDFRYFVLDSDSVNGAGTIFSYNPADNQAQSMLSSATDTMVLSPHLINVAHAGYKRFTTYILPLDHRSLSDLGGTFPNYGNPTLPYISVTSIFTLSSGNEAYNKFINQNAELNDSVTWSRGPHEFKAGVSYLHLQFLERSSNLGQGLFTFSGQVTGVSLADFLLGLPIQAQVAGPELEDSAVQNDLFLYAQDQWRIRPSLTLNFGLRYELSDPWVAQKGRAGNFIEGQQSTVFPNAPIGMVFAGDKGIPGGVVDTDYNNFAPRIGFAWSPLRSGKLSVRGGFGVAFDAINADAEFVGQPWWYSFIYPQPYSLSDPLRGQVAPPTQYDASNAQFYGVPTLNFLDRNLRTPYVYQANLGFQYEFPKQTILGVNYVGKFAHKLVLPFTFNPSLYAPGATVGNQDSRRRIQGYGDLEDFATIGSSNYHALQVAVVRHARALTINAAYTWSRSLDYGSVYNSESGYLPFPFDLRKNYGPSDFNSTQNMSFAYVWHLPTLLRGNRYLRQVLGGWNYSGIYSARTGTPYNITVGYDQALSTTPNQPPVVVGNWRLPSGRSRVQKMSEWFNRDAFEIPAVGTYGNGGRNLIIGPGSIGNSMAMAKEFILPGKLEHTRFQFRCDAFGIFNTPNLGGFGSSSLTVASGSSNNNTTPIPETNSGLGTTYSTFGERTLQLSLHLFF